MVKITSPRRAGGKYNRMHQNRAGVSVIIPNYNSKYLSKTLSSLPKNKNIEIIIVDDFSTKEYIKKCRKSGVLKNKKFIRPPRKGYAALARNVGIKHATRKYLLFLDSDVFLSKNCIKRLLKEIKHRDIVFPKILFENKTPMYPKYSREEKYPSISAIFMIKKSSLKKLDGYFDTNYGIYYEDTDFFYRCKLAGLKAKYVKNATAYHIIKEAFQKELQYYLFVRNYIYGKLKFLGIGGSPFIKIWNFLFVKFFVNGLFNYSWYERYHKKQKKNKLTLLFNHKTITNKTQLYLFYLFFKAVIWNIIKLGKTMKKRKRILNFYKI